MGIPYNDSKSKLHHISNKQHYRQRPASLRWYNMCSPYVSSASAFRAISAAHTTPHSIRDPTHQPQSCFCLWTSAPQHLPTTETLFLAILVVVRRRAHGHSSIPRMLSMRVRCDSALFFDSLQQPSVWKLSTCCTQICRGRVSADTSNSTYNHAALCMIL